MNDCHKLTIHEAAELLRSRQLSARELTEDCLRRIEETEPRISALLSVCGDLARSQAAKADERLARGDVCSLTGIPYIAKDVLCTEGVETTCGSRILQGFIPPYDATVISRLKKAGAVLLAKSNMDEFAMGSSTEHSAYHPTRNPWDLNRVPGGSSGGSAACVAAHQALFALGSDTGGSIRQPAGFCGVVGLKPTYGRVSRYGLVAFASSLDQVGPLTKNVADCAVVLSAISGQCAHDSTSSPRQAIEAAIDVLERLGATIVRDIPLPSTAYALAAYYIIAPSEASANLARYDGVKYGLSVEAPNAEQSIAVTRKAGFGDEVKRRIMLGTYALSAGYYDAYYLKAQKVRHLIREEFRCAFERCDILVTPTSPSVAFPLGAKLDDPMQMYLSDVFTIPVNIAGIPAMSVPAGYVEGLPVGLQLMGNWFDEETLLRVARVSSLPQPFVLSVAARQA